MKENDILISNVHGFENKGFLKLSEFREFLKISRSTFTSLVAEGVIPQPLKLTNRTHLWSKNVVRETLAKFEAKQGNKKPLGIGCDNNPYDSEIKKLEKTISKNARKAKKLASKTCYVIIKVKG